MSPLASISADPFATPERPADRGPILLGLIVLGLFIGGGGIWGSLAPLSSAAIAPGQVKVEGHRKTVQHLEGGIIREILVREGDEVHEGQLLLRLDDTQSHATFELGRGERNALKALEARLTAERDDLAAIPFPADLTTRRTEPNVAAILAGQQAIFQSRRVALEGQFDILQQRVSQLRSEIAGDQAQVASYTTQLALITDELRDVQELVSKGLERKPRLRALQRESANFEGLRGQQISAIAKAEQAIGETEMQRVGLINKQKNEVTSELRDVQTKLVDVEEKLWATTDVHRRTRILAPQAGKIVNLRHFTPGGIIKPGEPILDVVPQDDKLIIESELRPLDIEAVHVGLPAVVRLTAYKQRRTPLVHGTVNYVSADALTNEHTGQPYYTSRPNF